MAQIGEVTIMVGDLPQVQEALRLAQERIGALTAERDEWENRYEWLLGECGGTAPSCA